MNEIKIARLLSAYHLGLYGWPVAQSVTEILTEMYKNWEAVTRKPNGYWKDARR